MAGFEYNTGNLIEDLFHNIQKQEQDFLEKHKFPDLTLSEVRTLNKVGSCANPTISQLSSYLGVTLSTITITVNRLIQKGYLMKERKSRDRRLVNLWLTEKGKSVYVCHQTFQHRMEKLIKQCIHSEEYIYLKSSLERLKEGLKIPKTYDKNDL